MNKTDLSWIPDSYKIDPKKILRYLHTALGFMRTSGKLLDAHGMSVFIERVEDRIRDDIYNQMMPQIPVIDFNQILEEENANGTQAG